MIKAGFIILTGAILALFSVKVYSQDLIVTNENDSIFCKIKGINGNDMFYDLPGEARTGAYQVSLSQMKYYKYGYYRISKPKPVYDGVTRVRFGVNTGFSYRTAPVAEDIPSSLTSYLESLKSGHNFGMDFSYFFNDYLGIGLQANWFKTAEKETEGGNIRDKITIGFVGPEISARLLSRNKASALLTSVAIGYCGYKDESFYYGPLLIKGKTVGLGMDIGYDIGLSKNWAIGFQLAAFLGTITEVDVSQGSQSLHIELEEGKYESLERLDFSIGLRCRL